MTDPRKQRFAAYLRRLADHLHLSDWGVRIDDAGPRDPDDHCTITPIYGRKLAAVRLSEEFLDEPPDSQRQSLTHELIHCHLQPAWEIARHHLPDESLAGFRLMLEYAVDGLADAIAPHMPLMEDEPCQPSKVIHAKVSARTSRPSGKRARARRKASPSA